MACVKINDCFNELMHTFKDKKILKYIDEFCELNGIDKKAKITDENRKKLAEFCADKIMNNIPKY